MNLDTDDDAVTSRRLSLTHTGHSQSTMVQPLLKGSDKVQKRSKTFKKYQSDRFKRLQNVSILLCVDILPRSATREVDDGCWCGEAVADDPKSVRTRHATSVATQTRMRSNAP